jgi:hypothetical protein
MDLGSAMKKSLVAATVAAGVLAAAAPAEAQSLRRGFLPGLMGGLAIAAMAASAQAAQQQGGALYSLDPADLDDDVYWTEGPSAVRVARQPTRRISRAPLRPAPRSKAQPQAQAQTQAPRAGSGVVERCKASLALNARALGSVAVNVKEAGRETRARGGSVDLPVVARIEYVREGRKQVRQARVTCKINPEGRVVAFR